MARTFRSIAQGLLTRLLDLAELKPKVLGRVLYEMDESGHTFLCRLLNKIRHYGPKGTFVLLESTQLENGGHLCAFGVQCGRPTESYMLHMQECSERMNRMMRILQASGALVSCVWENPRFSSAGLCKCGKPDEKRLPLHDPLCPYRVEHSFPVSIEEYRAALGRPQ